MMLRLLSFSFLTLFCAALLTGCDSGNNEPEVLVEDIVVGTGAEAYEGSKVVVHQDGWVQGGELFWSTQEAGRPDSLVLRADEVLKGWMQGVVGMHVGGRRRLTIPPDLGYGYQEAVRCDSVGANCLIPAGSTLIFDVHLLGIVGAGAVN